MAPTSYPWQGGLGALGEETRSVCRTAGGEPATPTGLPMSVSAFPADHALPQLPIASDPALMLTVFRGHLWPLQKKAYRIEDCLLSWVRYLPGARCTFQYTLQLVESATGRERNQWVTVVIDAQDQPEPFWQKLRASKPQQEIPDAFLTFEPVSFIPELRMLVQVFPYDRRLPALPLLMAAPTPEIESVFLTGCGRGDWHAGVWSIEPIRYRTGARAVLRYEVKIRNAATGQTENRRFYVKVYRNEEGERTFSVLHALWGKADAGAEGFTVGRPIAYLSDLHALLQEEASGTTLGAVLLQDREAARTARRVARALAILNQDDVATTRRHSQEDEISDLKWAVNILQCVCSHLKAEVEAIVGAIAAGLQDVPSLPTHRDLLPAGGRPARLPRFRFLRGGRPGPGSCHSPGAARRNVLRLTVSPRLGADCRPGLHRRILCPRPEGLAPQTPAPLCRCCPEGGGRLIPTPGAALAREDRRLGEGSRGFRGRQNLVKTKTLAISEHPAFPTCSL